MGAVVVVVVDVEVELLVVVDATVGAGAVLAGEAAGGGEPPPQPARTPNAKARTAMAGRVAANFGIDHAPWRRVVFPGPLVACARAYVWRMSGLFPVEPVTDHLSNLYLTGADVTLLRGPRRSSTPLAGVAQAAGRVAVTSSGASLVSTWRPPWTTISSGSPSSSR